MKLQSMKIDLILVKLQSMIWSNFGEIVIDDFT